MQTLNVQLYMGAQIQLCRERERERERERTWKVKFFLSRALAWVLKLAGPCDGPAIIKAPRSLNLIEAFMLVTGLQNCLGVFLFCSLFLNQSKMKGSVSLFNEIFFFLRQRNSESLSFDIWVMSVYSSNCFVFCICAGLMHQYLRFPPFTTFFFFLFYIIVLLGKI